MAWPQPRSPARAVDKCDRWACHREDGPALKVGRRRGAIEIRSTAQLRATFVRILDEFRQRYLVSYSPANVPAEGWHPLTVRVKNRSVEVRARAGYTR